MTANARVRRLSIVDQNGKDLNVNTDPTTEQQATAATTTPAPADDGPATGMTAVADRIGRAAELLGGNLLARLNRWADDMDDSDKLNERALALVVEVGAAHAGLEKLVKEAAAIAASGWEPPKHKQPPLAAGDKITIRGLAVPLYADSFRLAMELAAKPEPEWRLTHETVLTIARVVGEGRGRRFATLVGLLPLTHIRRAK